MHLVSKTIDWVCISIVKYAFGSKSIDWVCISIWTADFSHVFLRIGISMEYGNKNNVLLDITSGLIQGRCGVDIPLPSGYERFRKSCNWLARSSPLGYFIRAV